MSAPVPGSAPGEGRATSGAAAPSARAGDGAHPVSAAVAAAQAARAAYRAGEVRPTAGIAPGRRRARWGCSIGTGRACTQIVTGGV